LHTDTKLTTPLSWLHCWWCCKSIYLLFLMGWEVLVKSRLYLFKCLHPQLQRIYSLQIIHSLKLENKQKLEMSLHLIFYITIVSESYNDISSEQFISHMKLESPLFHLILWANHHLYKTNLDMSAQSTALKILIKGP